MELHGLGYCNVIVVNDGSEKDIKRNLRDLNITYLEHRQNLGQGAALQTGFSYAIQSKAEIVVTLDADGQHDPAEIGSVIEPLFKSKADISLGSRFLTLEARNMPWSRKILIQTARLINYIFTGIRLSDAHNGLRALNRKAFQLIRITENRMAHATEILIEAKKHDLRIIEVPVTIHYTEYSKKMGQSPWNSIRIFIDLILYKLFA